MKKLFVNPTIILIGLGLFSTVQAQNTYQLQPLSAFGNHSDGSLRPNDTRALNLNNDPLMDNLSNQRGVAYDPLLTNLVVVDTHTGGGGSDHGIGGIYVLDAQTAFNVDNGLGGPFVLNTNGMPTLPNQLYPYASAAIADDGVVYVFNQISGGV